MVYDRRTGTYVPVFYLLLQAKAQAVYEAAWQEILRVEPKFKPTTFHCDFEKGLFSIALNYNSFIGLINSIKAIFPKAKLLGCLFHVKQAWRRKMLKLAISKEEISFFMKPGRLDILTLIPRDEIETHGIPFVRYAIVCR
jgi:hypothetical protein